MSRIGNKHITIPAGVTVEINEKVITVKGPKGTLTYNIAPQIDVQVEGAEIVVTRPNDEKLVRSLHGTTRANINNMVVGVSQGFEKILEIVGVGYKCAVVGKEVQVSGGHSHLDILPIPEGITVTCPNPLEVHVCGCDKQAVGELAALIRKVRKPEPYKGKGIHYQGEYIRRKEGKKAK